jgi:hypothetical protein
MLSPDVGLAILGALAVMELARLAAGYGSFAEWREHRRDEKETRG